MVLHQAPRRWDQGHITTHLMTIGVISIGGMLLDLVHPHYIIILRLSAHAGIGNDLYCCLIEAIPERNKHAEQLVTFSASLSTTTLGKWQQMVSAWDANHDQPNPYTISVTCEDRVHWSMNTI